MKMRKVIIKLLLLAAFSFLFAGCAGNTNIPQTEETEIAAEPSVQEAEEESEEKTEETKAEKEEIPAERREIPIDFPFYGDQQEHKLVLAVPEEGQSAYELIY
ncbi:MAG: hypothetical protein K2N43_02360, partial [Lachnospiraceae bacterium]|nr:hypothetical protein [Lachnospiraceae bacterium]